MLFVLDDCLMLRLAYGGSAQKFGLTPDLTFLGKFLGGGTPVGAVGGRAEILEITNPHRENALYHGGSYNGNILGSIAGRVTLEHLTQEKIDVMRRPHGSASAEAVETEGPAAQTAAHRATDRFCDGSFLYPRTFTPGQRNSQCLSCRQLPFGVRQQWNSYHS